MMVLKFVTMCMTELTSLFDDTRLLWLLVLELLQSTG